MIEHSGALTILEEHFKALQKQPIDAKIGEGQLYARPLSCAQWHELDKLKGMDHSIRLIFLAVVDENDRPLFKEADLYRIETRVDGAVITALANMAYEVIVKGADDLKKGLGRATATSSPSATPSPSDSGSPLLTS